MKIDRARFLLLTSAIAGGACAAARQESAQVGTIVDIPAASVPPAAPPPAVTVAQDDARPKKGPVLPEPEEEEDDDDDDELSSSFKLSPRPAKCDNTVGTPGLCATLRAPGPTCESFADTKDQCSKMRTGFKPRVAEKLVQCFAQASGSQAICDFQKPSKCALVALQSACIEPSTDAKCQSVVSACKARSKSHVSRISMDLCQAALSAVTDKNRAKIAACMVEGCDVQSCFWDLK